MPACNFCLTGDAIWDISGHRRIYGQAAGNTDHRTAVVLIFFLPRRLGKGGSKKSGTFSRTFGRLRLALLRQWCGCWRGPPTSVLVGDSRLCLVGLSRSSGLGNSLVVDGFRRNVTHECPPGVSFEDRGRCGTHGLQVWKKKP